MNDETRQLIHKLRTLEDRVAQLEAANLSLSAADILASVQVTGTWTPALAFGGASTGITYASRTGYYIKVGTLVWAACDVRLSNKGSATGAATITGLPYALSGVLSTGPASWISMATALTTAFVLGNSSQMELRGAAAATTTNTVLSDTHFGNSSIWIASLTYRTS